MEQIPEAFHDLFEKRTIAHLTTMNPDGTPQATPVWIGYDPDEGDLLINTERHRRKARNAKRTPDVAVSMTDPENPYRFLSVTGEVESVSAEGAREHIDELARRYLGEEEYPTPVESERVILRIRPTDVNASDVSD
ncbi:PPOX class F420-dependent oxidoreductase [Halarchaeum sp. P4]|uniref:PPOX class F420-dependent oxidoreductase n=1 Tax=Halarchaeum sp. P4 TaxID=3421639 RepID=UPI003EBC261C